MADRIRDLIRAGEFPPGSRLPGERELAQTLGVSRPSLREALIALEIDGAVAVRMGSGVYVAARRARPRAAARPLGDSPTEIMEARLAIEGALVVTAAARADAAFLDTLRRSVAAMGRMVDKGDVPLAVDRAFHLAIAAQAGNSVLARLTGQLFDERKTSILARLSHRFDTPATWRAALAEHTAILHAIEAADPHRAEAAMRTHLQCSAERWLGD